MRVPPDGAARTDTADRLATTCKVLLDAGLVEREQRGSWAYFRVVPNGCERSRSPRLAVPFYAGTRAGVENTSRSRSIASGTRR